MKKSIAALIGAVSAGFIGALIVGAMTPKTTAPQNPDISSRVEAVSHALASQAAVMGEEAGRRFSADVVAAQIGGAMATEPPQMDACLPASGVKSVSLTGDVSACSSPATPKGCPGAWDKSGEPKACPPGRVCSCKDGKPVDVWTNEPPADLPKYRPDTAGLGTNNCRIEIRQYVTSGQWTDATAEAACAARVTASEEQIAALIRDQRRKQMR